MLQAEYPFYLANQAEQPNADLEVMDKYTGEVASRVAMADAADISRAIDAAEAAREPFAKMAAYQRREVIEHCVQRFEERFDELAYSLCVEGGKPLKDAKGEVTRLIDTFRIAASETMREAGEVLTMDISTRSTGYRGMYKRVPIGPCSFISPFNFPLNLAAHKVAPALAVGCPFVLKPASLTPIGALIIGEVLAETHLPKGAFSILPCKRDGADLFTTDERFKLLSFTGSPSVGWDLKAKAGKKKVILELGGNAAVIVDDTNSDLDDVVDRMITGGFYQSGQSCIGVQRVLIHDAVYDEFKTKFVDKAKSLKHGDPKQEDTFIGPMISEKEAERLKGWIDEAVADGASVLCGGELNGQMLQATVLENVSDDVAIHNEEAFGPTVNLYRFNDFDEAIKQVNDSSFGLQAGVFTQDIHRAMQAWDELDVGGVLINETSNWRVDHMPYGGVKDSGLGREGVKFAMQDMSEERLLVIRDK